jgi:HEPN domain-containing protein
LSEFLKRNAEYLERKAREALEEGAYGFAVFFAEQALQLYIKHILAKSFGDYPKTHRFSVLFEVLRNVVEGAKKFYEENVELFEILEDSYVGVRYLGREYSRNTAEKVLRVLDKFKEAFKDVL